MYSLIGGYTPKPRNPKNSKLKGGKDPPTILILLGLNVSVKIAFCACASFSLNSRRTTRTRTKRPYNVITKIYIMQPKAGVHIPFLPAYQRANTAFVRHRYSLARTIRENKRDIHNDAVSQKADFQQYQNL